MSAGLLHTPGPVSYLPVFTIKNALYYRQQPQQLFQNLLESVLKYHRQPIIIRAELKSGTYPAFASHGANPAKQYHLLSFADNGTGFDTAGGERIF